MENFKSIKGYEGLYEVSNFGNVKSLQRITSHGHNKKEKILVINKNSQGYSVVSLYNSGVQKTFSVHQLVAIAFLNHKPNGYTFVVNHKNFIRSDNKLENLEVVTVRENANQKHLKSTSKYTGVCFVTSTKKWHSQIVINKKVKHLGFYNNEYDAHLAYEEALKKIY